MSSLGMPFQGKLWYWVEDSYGSGPNATAYPISIKVLDVRLGVSDKHKPLRGIDKPEADILLEQCEDLTLHIEYIPQSGDKLLKDAVERTNCSLKSLCFYLETNSCSSVTADKSIWLIKGSKNKSTKISASHNTEYVYAMDFSVKSVVTIGDGEYEEPSALSGGVCAFNCAGSINDGNNNPLAYILESINITFDNGIQNHWDHDSLVKLYAIESEVGVEGSVDISLDEGGSKHLDDVLNQKEFNIIINLGGTGYPKITLNKCRWKSSEIDVNTSGDIMKESAPFTAVDFTISTVA